MSKIATGLVLISLLMALSFGVAFAESGTANETTAMNNTSVMEPGNNTTIEMPANNTTVEMPANNTTEAGK
jgi:hypothetical protein